MRPATAIFTFLFTMLLLACGPAGENGPPATRAANPGTIPAAKPFIGPLSGPRIVSTVPAASLNLVLIGAADRLVGVTKYDTIFLPENLRNIPIVGDYESMNFEQLVSARPTALIVQVDESRMSSRLREVTAAHRIEIVNLRFDRIDDIWGSVRTLGRVTGMQDQTKNAIDRAQQDLKEIAILYARTKKPRVVYVVSPRLNLIAGGTTFIDEMLTHAGAENAAAKAGKGYLELGREAIVSLEPDVLLIGAADEFEMQPDDPRMRPWLTLPVAAARNKRVYLVNDGNSLMASIDIGKNVRALAEMIHRGESLPPPPAPPPSLLPASNVTPATRPEAQP